MNPFSRSFATLGVRLQQDICFVQMHRPEAGNAINSQLVEELGAVLIECETRAKVVVLEGLPEVFCSGADFNELRARFDSGMSHPEQDPAPLYDLWQRLAMGPYISIAHVRGRAIAGGVGFVAACDIVLSDEKASFGLSELLFGLLPACVLPFLIPRIGVGRANYLTVTTQPISARQAEQWGLVDICDPNSDSLLKRQLVRLGRLGKDGIARYKRYANSLDDALVAARPKALQANLEAFSHPDNMHHIGRYVRTGRFPWEG